MQFYFNDLSIERQFQNAVDLERALDRLMKMRQVALGHKCPVHFYWSASIPQVNDQKNLLQAIKDLDRNKSEALRSWISRKPPVKNFQNQFENEPLFCNGRNVTDKAVGEAARKIDHGTASAVISIEPSSWCQSPLEVERGKKRTDTPIVVQNFWEMDALRLALEEPQSPITTWKDLEKVARRRFTSLFFAKDAFNNLRQPPSSVVVEHFLYLLKVLQDLKNEIDKPGPLTAKGKEIRRMHFTRSGAHFSDSSEREKRTFRRQLTFKHPKQPGKTMLCPWHGKFQHRNDPYRLHFFPWPIKANEPVYVVYAGLKRTKK